MKDNSKIILLGAALAGLAYAVGKKNGHNECLYRCQKALINAIYDAKKDGEDESQ